MGKFDGIVDDILHKARSAADTAGRKTSEMVEISKLKLQSKGIASEIEKSFNKLGTIVYESKKSEENFEDVIALSISELDDLHEKLEETEQAILLCQREYKEAQAAAKAASAERPVKPVVKAEPRVAEAPAEDPAPVEATPEDGE